MTAEQLDPEAWAGLRSLPKDLAVVVARHLVMSGRLLDEEPERAYLHAKTARRLGSRVATVREGCGIAAYQTGHWAEALAELRAARRLSGREAYLPVMADCERGLGRPERALSLARSPEAERLHQAERVEMRIVEAGARRDMEQYEAAVLALQIPELKEQRLRPWSARLLYAYADALGAAGRDDEAGEWFAKAAAADRDGETDAAERYAELEGLEILDTEDDVFTELDIDADEQDTAADPRDLDGVGRPDRTSPEPAESAESSEPAAAPTPGTTADRDLTGRLTSDEYAPETVVDALGDTTAVPEAGPETPEPDATARPSADDGPEPGVAAEVEAAAGRDNEGAEPAPAADGQEPGEGPAPPVAGHPRDPGDGTAPADDGAGG